MKNIPQQIHLVYKTYDLPEDYRSFLNIIKEFHPFWNVQVYDDMDARQIIARELPGMLPIYDAYERDIQRADLFRLAVVYLYGGFYMDFDMLCLKNMDALCQYALVLGEEKTLSDEECVKLGHQFPLRIANYMFGSGPRHPFWLDVLQEAEKRSHARVLREEDVLQTTGPGLLTDVYHQVGSTYPDIELLMNPDKKCMKWCERISCHFGDYAAHLHQGKWRWNNK